jgi:hypothetical protein
MNAQTWAAAIAAVAAVGAWFVALKALAYNRQSADAANRAARAAEEQTKIQQQLRIDAAQPYVWVDVRPDEVTGTLLNLVIGNSGPTFAHNVRVKVDPPLPTCDQLKERAEAAQALLANGIGSLGPSRVLSWPLGQGFNLLKDSGSQAHTFTVTADGPFGSVPPLSYAVDLAHFRGMLDRPAGSLYQLTMAVQGLTERLGQQQSERDTPPDVVSGCDEPVR